MALTSSPELAAIEDKIALLNERIALGQERTEYASKRRWTNYITLDPLRLIQNIAGGGDVQRDRLAHADLEIKTATLEAQRAELERRRGEIEAELFEKITQLVLDYEADIRKEALIRVRLATNQTRQQVLEVDYRLGGGSTTQMLATWEKQERLEDQLVTFEIGQQQTYGELVRLVYGSGSYSQESSGASGVRRPGGISLDGSEAEELSKSLAGSPR